MQTTASNANVSSIETTLKGVTPHMLAAAMLGSVMERKDDWAATNVEVTAVATQKFPMACEFYQLRIFLDLLTRRFGTGVSSLVEAGLVSVTNVSGLNLFPMVMAAISAAREVGPPTDAPDDARLGLDCQVADQALRIIGESDEEKNQLRPLLAESLSYARIWAEGVFPELVRKIEFSPESVAFVKIETAYNGLTNRWRQHPGCFERHLQRMEGNPLFPESQRKPTDEMISEARAKDDAEAEQVKHDVSQLFEDVKTISEPGKISATTILDLIQHRAEPLLERAAALGHSPDALRIVGALKGFMDSLLSSALHRSPEECKPFQKDWRRKTNVFIAQNWRDDTPISKEDAVRALLCENVSTVQEVLRIYSELDPAVVDSMREMAALHFEMAELDGFIVPGGQEKHDLFGCRAREAAPSAPVKRHPWWRMWR